MTSKIRVLLADDHKMLLSAVGQLIAGQPDMEVVGQAENGDAAAHLAMNLAPDVVLMDINMPGVDGIEATRKITAGFASDDAPGAVSPKIIALSATFTARMAVQMFEAGASAYVLKSAAFEELAKAIRLVLNGDVYVSPAVARVLGRAATDPTRPPVTLTAREQETLQLLAEGKMTKEVAMSLRISIKTAESHRRNLMEKLQIDSIAEITRHAVREGFSPL